MGSARTRAWIAGRGMILDVPTVTFPGRGAIHPIQRGTIVDVPGTSRMLQRLLDHRLPRLARPVIVLTAPVLDGLAFRTAARTAVDILHPRAVVTVPGARAVALAAGADHTRPLVVVDIGAHLMEVVLLADQQVVDARRTALGTTDLGDDTPPRQLTDAVVAMVQAMVRDDHTPMTAGALQRGILLSGGGALRPDVTLSLPDVLGCPVRTAPSPHTAAVRGAAGLLGTAHARALQNRGA
ncbi:rod shape-determining protein [Streptomyces boninensis]|uniref:rod shape-determining protein n=1 Tax=Streptomyces boninensis TaxID=2039455 RepID=UPI003B227DFE